MIMRAAILLLLGSLTLPVHAQSPERKIEEAHALLVKELEGYAEWCAGERLSLERALVFEQILKIDTEHADARRVLGFKKDRKSGEWKAPKKPKKYTNKNQAALEEAPQHLSEAVAAYVEVLVPILETPDLSPEVVRILEDEVLEIEPGNATIHQRRDEVRQGGGWVLAETATASATREEMRGTLRELLAAELPEGGGTPSPYEGAIGLDFKTAAGPAVRVLATADLEESERTARAMSAGLELFNDLFELEASYPYQCNVFLLASATDKEAFLGKHPKVTEEHRAAVEPLDGAGVPHTGDWGIWIEDPEKRMDLAVRMGFDWTFNKGLGIGFEHGWAHEGFGMYLTWCLLGTRLNFFAPGGLDPETAYASRNRLLDPDLEWLDEAHALLTVGEGYALKGLFSKGVGELTSDDILASYALAAYLLEGHPDQTAAILTKVARGGSPTQIFQEEIGMDLAVLNRRIVRWFDERKRQPDVVSEKLTDGELTAAWGSLGDKDKEKVIAQYEANLALLTTSQLRTIRALIASAGVDPDDIPLPEELVYFDPKTHAPAQPIAREWLDEEDSRVKSLRRTVFGRPDPRALPPAYRYHWATGEIERTGSAADHETIFARAVQGLPPDLDLALAAALKQMDEGIHRRIFAGFAHAYTDREGNAFPGVTLYDAWESEMEMEMPDVDAMGIMHEVLDEYDRWEAPINASLHEILYLEIEEIFVRGQQYRKVREALASTLLLAHPVSPIGFDSMHTNLHSLWAKNQNDVATLSPEVPDEEWRPWINDWIRECKSDKALWTLGWKRQIALRRDSKAVRSAMIAALHDAGAIASPAASERD